MSGLVYASRVRFLSLENDVPELQHNSTVQQPGAATRAAVVAAGMRRMKTAEGWVLFPIYIIIIIIYQISFSKNCLKSW